MECACQEGGGTWRGRTARMMKFRDCLGRDSEIAPTDDWRERRGDPHLRLHFIPRRYRIIPP